MTRSLSRAGLVAAVVGVFTVLPASPALAHGIGGRADLPVPVSFFVVGAGVAVVVSFVAVAVLWPQPRLQAPRPEKQLAARWIGPARRVLSWLGLAALLLVVLAGIFNREGGRTISPVLVWVYFWLVVPFLAAIVGNWWKAISPWRSLARWINSGVPERTGLAVRVGLWPAVIAFVAFTWLELIAQSSDEARTLTIAALLYSLYLLVTTRYLGVETGLRSTGAFENYNEILGGIAPVRWSVTAPEGPGTAEVASRAKPSLVYRGWLRGLPTLETRPGFAAFVIAMIGTVTYDGMSGSGWWSDTMGSVAREEWFGTIGLFGTVLAIGAGYLAASRVAAAMAGDEWGTMRVARSFAHTLVPIALAYAFAHYFTLVLVEGQILLHAASDPFGLGWDLFGTAGWRISWVPTPEVVWYLQVASIVAGHVAGVVLAHDRALSDFGGRVAVRTQYAMLVLMVALTSLGLLILSG